MLLLLGDTTDAIQIHYWFTDESHTIDAAVDTKCTAEVLAIIKEVANLFDFDVVVETAPSEEGGFKKILRVLKKKEEKDGTISQGVITGVVGGLVLAILSLPVYIAQKEIDQMYEDPTLKELQKEQLKKLKRENEQAEGNETADFNSAVKKRRSNFYDTLNKYDKIDKVSFALVDPSGNDHETEKTIERKEFGQFIMLTDDIAPLDVEEANIEIIAPVLKKGNYKWIGLYNGQPIKFTMKSEEFKNDVQSGTVEFKNGTNINCKLHIKRKITNEGDIVLTDFQVVLVHHYFQNDKPIETVEGKKHRQKKEARNSQLDLWGSNLDEEDED